MITGPAVVTVKGSRHPIAHEAAAEVEENANARPPAGGAEPSTPLGEKPAPANDDRKRGRSPTVGKTAIVTTRDRKTVQRQREARPFPSPNEEGYNLGAIHSVCATQHSKHRWQRPMGAGD